MYLCRTYLGRCDKIITVSDGLAFEYEREFNVAPQVVMSLPVYHDLPPSKVNEREIRIIHHGAANKSRHLESMIKVMEWLDGRFILDLMLVGDIGYIRTIQTMAEKYNNVRLIAPISMKQIVPFVNQYDVGLFLCPPTNLNLKYALPNKLFEFIQGRLVVAIGPSVEMKKIVERYDCGIVAGSFDPRDMAERLKELNVEKIMHYKRQSGLAARELNADSSRAQIDQLVMDLVVKRV